MHTCPTHVTTHGQCNDAYEQEFISPGVSSLPLKGIRARHDDAEGTADLHFDVRQATPSQHVPPAVFLLVSFLYMHLADPLRHKLTLSLHTQPGPVSDACSCLHCVCGASMKPCSGEEPHWIMGCVTQQNMICALGRHALHVPDPKARMQRHR